MTRRASEEMKTNMIRRRILVVDDDPDCLATLSESLEWEGFGVLLTSRGHDALRMVAESNVALVILDLNLLDVDGIQVCRRLRQQSEVPIIILSGRSSVSDRVLGLEAGADDYVVKPCDCLELCARIRAILRRENKVNQRRDPYTIGPLHIDPNVLTVKSHGKAVALTNTEFQILEILAKNVGKAVSRQQILRSVWGANNLDKDSRVIDVHVQHLRSKLEDKSKGIRLIVTVPKVGYMLSPASHETTEYSDSAI